ncbi:MAG: hypothetical protein MJZ97_01060 [Bacteroidales bacterium]|nr:hypothetical protein [Bacteroidales bacterium]
MESLYLDKMRMLGFDQLVCEIFPTWENVKDEILIPERKTGSGNGTIHVFLGTADAILRQEFPAYYQAVENGEDPVEKAINITHYFLYSNVLSMLGHLCRYYYSKNLPIEVPVCAILSQLETYYDNNGLLSTKSLFKLSVGSSKPRPYFKQFDNNGVFSKIIRPILLPNSAYKVCLLKNRQNEYAAFWLLGFRNLSDFEVDSTVSSLNKNDEGKCFSPLQQIFYGAPGTGKSNTIKRDVEDQGKIHFRTTFHPDSDYSTFVGCYKPTLKLVKKTVVIGQDEKEVKPLTGGTDSVEQISYQFVPQAFTKAYCEAWNHYNENEESEPVFLIIEEINRGNCAQIFGDIFQLLDRKNGFSEYPIDADEDLKKFLLNGTKDDGTPWLVNKKGIENGQLCLPPNFYIWATMNTSDQSLFPIDSAFKRRWDWKYVPIDYEKEGWSIVAKGVSYSWSDFLKKMNDLVANTTDSEDKMLGFYFAKAKDGIINADTFVGKVVFYLWNDVFKDYGLPKEILNGAESKEFAFRNFFMIDGSANEDMVKRLLENIGVAKDSDIPTDESISTDDIVNNMVGGKKDTSRYKINGTGSYPKTDLATEVMKVYVTNHPGKPVNDIISEWTSLNVAITDIVTDEAAHNLKKSKTSDPRFDYRTGKVQVGTEVLFVTRCWAIENVSDFVEKVNARSWGVHIETV